MTDDYGNQTEEEIYASGGEVCSCCGCINCHHEVDDSKIKKEWENERNKE